MPKIRTAVIFGGKSPEYKVSLESVYSVLSHINRDKYYVIPVGITEEGDWYYYRGEYENILNDTWHRDKENLLSLALSGNHFKKGFLGLAFFPYYTEKTGKKVHCRESLKCREYQLSAAIPYHLLCAWIKTGLISWCMRQV